MKKYIISMLAALTCAGILPLARRMRKRRSHGIAANVAEGTHANGALTKRSGAVLGARHLTVKTGASAGYVIATELATDLPLGVVPDEADAAELAVAVLLFGVAPGTLKTVAGGVVENGDLLTSGADGKVVKLPTDAGSYWIVGRALNDAADGTVVETQHCFPTLRVVPV